MRWVSPEVTRCRNIDNFKELKNIKIYKVDKKTGVEEWVTPKSVYLYWKKNQEDWYYYQNNDPSTGIILGLKVKHSHEQGYMPGNFGEYIYDINYGANQKDYVIPDGVTEVKNNIFAAAQYLEFKFDYGGTQYDEWIRYPFYYDYPDGMNVYYPDSITAPIKIGSDIDQRRTSYYQHLEKIRFPNNFNLMTQVTQSDFSDDDTNFALKSLTVPPGTTTLSNRKLSSLFPYDTSCSERNYLCLHIDWSNTGGNDYYLNYFVKESNYNYSGVDSRKYKNLKTLNIIRDEAHPTITIEPHAFIQTSFYPLMNAHIGNGNPLYWYTLQEDTVSSNFSFDKSMLDDVYIYCNCSKENIVFPNDPLIAQPTFLSSDLDNTIASYVASGATYSNVYLYYEPWSGSDVFIKSYGDTIPSMEQIFKDANLVTVKSSYQLFNYLESIGHVFYNQDITND